MYTFNKQRARFQVLIDGRNQRSGVLFTLFEITDKFDKALITFEHRKLMKNSFYTDLCVFQSFQL